MGNCSCLIRKVCLIVQTSGLFENRNRFKLKFLKRFFYGNCSLSGIEQGSNLTVEIIKKQKEDANIFYSLDNGNTWIPYTHSFQIQYTGKNEIKAKCVNSNGAEFKSRAMLCDKYAYDSEFDCTAEDALDKKTYDGDKNTYQEVMSIDVPPSKVKFYFGHTSLYNLVIGTQNKEHYIIFPFHGGCINPSIGNEFHWEGNKGYVCYENWPKEISYWEGNWCKIGYNATVDEYAKITELWYDASLYSED